MSQRQCLLRGLAPVPQDWSLRQAPIAKRWPAAPKALEPTQATSAPGRCSKCRGREVWRTAGGPILTCCRAVSLRSRHIWNALPRRSGPTSCSASSTRRRGSCKLPGASRARTMTPVMLRMCSSMGSDPLRWPILQDSIGWLQPLTLQALQWSAAAPPSARVAQSRRRPRLHCPQCVRPRRHQRCQTHEATPQRTQGYASQRPLYATHCRVHPQEEWNRWRLCFATPAVDREPLRHDFLEPPKPLKDLVEAVSRRLHRSLVNRCGHRRLANGGNPSICPPLQSCILIPMVEAIPGPPASRAKPTSRPLRCPETKAHRTSTSHQPNILFPLQPPAAVCLLLRH